MRLRSVCASGPPRVIQSLLVFATFRNRSGLLCHRAAASCFGTSALPTGVVLLFLGSPPVRLAALRLWYSDRELPRGQGAIPWFWQIHHNSAPAHWRVFVRHSARKETKIRNRILFDRRSAELLAKYADVCASSCLYEFPLTNELVQRKEFIFHTFYIIFILVSFNLLSST